MLIPKTNYMKHYLYILLLFIASGAAAQLPDDALRTAWFTQNGTARNMATGGVMGSLGGDITANHVNPAGIGLYKTREFVPILPTVRVISTMAQQVLFSAVITGRVTNGPAVLLPFRLIN
jgi:hypothetical protein